MSAIMPAYNSEATIARALDSVRLQTVRPAELIVVDDGSADRTLERVEGWRDMINRRRTAVAGLDEPCERVPVRVFRLERNSGPAAARNRGIREARGEWIAFLDADDVWLRHRLERQLDAAGTYPEAVLFCGRTAPFGYEAEGKGARGAGKERGGRDGGDRVLRLEDFVAGNPVATSTVLVRKPAVEEVGAFDERFRGPEDYDLWMRIVARRRAVLLEEPLARYRSEAGSLSMDDRRFLPQVLAVLDKAFSEGGAMAGMWESRQTAVSNQLWNASWMAFQRGAKGRALRLLAAAYLMNQRSAHPVARAWGRLLLRYLAGRRG